MKKRIGIHARIASVLAEDGLRVVRGWQGESRALFVNGNRCNAAMLRDLKATAETRLGQDVSPAAIHKGLAKLATEETKAQREARERMVRERKATNEASAKAARDAKQARDAIKRRDAHEALANIKAQPPRAEWFAQFNHDGVARLDRFAEEFLGASAHYSRMFSAFVIGACRRFGHAPGSPLILNAAFTGVGEAEAEAGLRALFEPFFGTFFEGDAEPYFFVPRTHGNFVIFIRKEDRADPFAFELLARRTHDVTGETSQTPRTFVLAVAEEEAPPLFRKIDVRRMDLEAIRTFRAALIGEAKDRALKQVQVDPAKRLRARRQRWLRDYASLTGGNNVN